MCARVIGIQQNAQANHGNHVQANKCLGLAGIGLAQVPMVGRCALILAWAFGQRPHAVGVAGVGTADSYVEFCRLCPGGEVEQLHHCPGQPNKISLVRDSWRLGLERDQPRVERHGNTRGASTFLWSKPTKISAYRAHASTF
jgi:hypothetical protein